ncbi:hypothetical protein [Aureimonas sp. N4]|uniref:hypothetical protein n=1 Tax=Aureimonas sp. N4 TaxID=1638165 RepID=UPI0007860CD8|nr:hypothetical protein [Aureimonas sp. N4]
MSTPTTPNSTTSIATDEPECRVGTRLVTEAEALCNLIYDLGVIPAVNLTNDSIYFTIDENPKAGAFDVIQIIAKRASDDEVFFNDAVCAIASCGYYLTSAPAVISAIKTGAASDVIIWLEVSGLLICHGYQHDADQTPFLLFTPCPGRPIAPNAHLLMEVVSARFASEPVFARDMTQAAIAAGRSQHNA